MTFVSIPFDWARRHTAGAVRQGISLESLLESSLIAPRGDLQEELITPMQRVLLCTTTTLALEDATHGLARSGLGACYGPIGLRMALGCATLEGAIQALSRLYTMASRAVRIQLRTEQEMAIVSVHIDAKDEDDVAYIEENSLIWIFMQCLHFLGRAPPVFEVSVRDPRHFNMGMNHWGLRGRVVYGDVTAFRFPRHLLSVAPATRAGDNVFQECCESWLAHVDGYAPVTGHESYVSEYGFVRFADIVRDSGKSPNTMRRWLRSSNGNFRDARRRALVAAASDRLSSSDDSVEMIAAELGYSDASSFRRFLKAATGLTPQQVRDRRGAAGASQDSRALAQLKVLAARMNF